MYGYEEGHGGSSGYVGVVTYSEQSDQRRYMIGDISDLNYSTDGTPTGVEYCLGMWMSLADSSMYSTGTFAARIGGPWQTSFDQAFEMGHDSTTWIQTPYLFIFNTSAVGKDGWTYVEASVFPYGGFYTLMLPLLFGNFQTDSQIDTVRVSDTGIPMAMYYIDDVELRICATSVPSIGAPPHLCLAPSAVGAGQVVQVTSSAPLTRNTGLRVLDAWGRPVHEQVAVGGGTTTEIVVSDWTPGVYFVRLDGVDHAPLRLSVH